MMASFDVPDSERHLYFLLNNTFHLCSPPSSSGYKIAGLYSIHHEDKCRYVGQSQNLPSRLANHLSGHYSYADEFRIYFIAGFEDFYDRGKESRKIILENNELRIIQELKPIDNIISNYDREIPEEMLFDSLCEIQSGYQIHDLSGFKSKHYITIVECVYQSMDDIDNRIMSPYIEEMDRIRRLLDAKI